MIVCTKCGEHNGEADTFCGNCKTYLEWDGHRLAEPEEDQLAPSAGPELQPSRPTVVERIRAVIAPSAPDAGTSPTSDPGQAQRPPMVGEALRGDDSPSPSSSPGPTADPHPSHDAILAIQPVAQPVRRRRPGLPPEDRRPIPGETVCPSCGAGNAPARRFCRRCASELADAVVVPAVSWYRRLFRRPAQEVLVGARPKDPGPRRRIPWPLVAVVVLGVLVVIGWPHRAPAVAAWEALRDRLQGEEVVNPQNITVSSSAPSHPAAALRDGVTNSTWTPAHPGPSAGQWAQVTFTQPIRLVFVQVFSGASEQDDAFLAQDRPAQLHLTLTTQGGGHVERVITLQDHPGAQDFGVRVSEVTSVRMTVVSTYKPSSSTFLSIGEVTFFKRS